MVIIRSEPDASCGRLILTPNRSATWNQNLLLIASMLTIYLVIGISFSLAGAYVVPIFSGLELIILFFVMYYVFRQSMQKEVITLLPDKVIIEKGVERPDQTWAFQRLWTHVLVDQCSEAHERPYVAFQFRDETVEIGSFLNDPEKERLIEQIRYMVKNFTQ